MANIRPLERTLMLNVAWNKARINFLAKFLIALIQVRTVNLAEIASAFSWPGYNGFLLQTYPALLA